MWGIREPFKTVARKFDHCKDNVGNQLTMKTVGWQTQALAATPWKS